MVVELVFLSGLLLFLLILGSGQLYVYYLISIIHKPFLLQAYYRARSAYPEPPQDSFRIIPESRPMPIKYVPRDQSASPAETRLAEHGDALSTEKRR